jgi:hypothetical protein
VTAEYGCPALAGFSVAAVWVVVLIAVIGSGALRGLDRKDLSHAER